MSKPKPRRRYEAEFRQRVVEESFRPGASIAGVALDHGLNANLVHRWRRESRAAQPMVATVRPAWLAVTETPPEMPLQPEVRVMADGTPIAKPCDVTITLKRGTVQLAGLEFASVLELLQCLA